MRASLFSCLSTHADECDTIFMANNDGVIFMSITFRNYKLLSDFAKVSDFLHDNYDPVLRNNYLLKPFWEYAHTHPAFNHKLTHRFGLWEDRGEIVAVACYEMDLGECLMSVAQGYEYLYDMTIDYTFEHLSVSNEGKQTVSIWTTDANQTMIDALQRHGFSQTHQEAITIYDYKQGFDTPSLPDGFEAVSLDMENDFKKINDCLWKGFDHGDEPDDDIDCRRLMQSGPNFRKDLTTVIKAPNGEYVCFAGMWVDNDYAYLEPLATVPAYRKLGLAKAALMIGMQKTSEEGAQSCYGGVIGFYEKIGFKTVGYRLLFRKSWSI